MSTDTGLRVGVIDLRRHPGERRHVERSVVLDDIGITSAHVPADRAITVDLELEAVSDGIVAHGTIVVPWEGECRRCLTDVQGETEAEIREVFSKDAVEGETYRLDEDVVDLEPMLRDAALLVLPLAPLCGPDCAGPAPVAFPTGPATEDAAPADPRWAALDELRFDSSLESDD